MTNEPFGLLAVFVYLGAVVLSLPAAAAVLLLARRVGIDRAASIVGVAGVVTVAVVGLGVDAGLGLAGHGTAALVVLWALPALLGRWAVRRYTGLASDVALGYAVAGLPPALAASAVWFVAPGGPTRYNLTFLSGPALWAGLAVLLTIVLFGPGLVGIGLVRLVRRRRG